jgi:hypothetical protein
LLRERIVRSLTCVYWCLRQNNWEYEVFEPAAGGEYPDVVVLFTAISSNPDWVRHDAVGYHTRERFDALFGEGNWVVDRFEHRVDAPVYALG